jgi:hypothetical protein
MNRFEIVLIRFWIRKIIINADTKSTLKFLVCFLISYLNHRPVTAGVPSFGTTTRMVNEPLS